MQFLLFYAPDYLFDEKALIGTDSLHEKNVLLHLKNDFENVCVREDLKSILSKEYFYCFKNKELFNGRVFLVFSYSQADNKNLMEYYYTYVFFLN